MNGFRRIRHAVGNQPSTDDRPVTGLVLDVVFDASLLDPYVIFVSAGDNIIVRIHIIAIDDIESIVDVVDEDNRTIAWITRDIDLACSR